MRISVCHCPACQRRTGSAFGVQARYPAEQVRIDGEYRQYRQLSDEGEGRTFSFCPECGATVFYAIDPLPGFVTICRTDEVEETLNYSEFLRLRGFTQGCPAA